MSDINNAQKMGAKLYSLEQIYSAELVCVYTDASMKRPQSAYLKICDRCFDVTNNLKTWLEKGKINLQTDEEEVRQGIEESRSQYTRQAFYPRCSYTPKTSVNVYVTVLDKNLNPVWYIV